MHVEGSTESDALRFRSGGLFPGSNFGSSQDDYPSEEWLPESDTILSAIVPVRGSWVLPPDLAPNSSCSELTCGLVNSAYIEHTPPGGLRLE